MSKSKPDAFDWMVEHFIQDGIIVPHDPTGKWWGIERREFAHILRLQHASAVRLAQRHDVERKNMSHDFNAGNHLACAKILADLAKMKKGTR